MAEKKEPKKKTVFLKYIIYLNGQPVMPSEKGVEMDADFADKLIKQGTAMTMEARAAEIQAEKDRKAAAIKEQKRLDDLAKEKDANEKFLNEKRQKVMESKRRKK